MPKLNIIGFEDWKVFDGFAEGSGRGEKIWLQSSSGEIGLFKFPKTDPATLSVTTEFISEHLAYRIGEILGVKTAKIDIGIRNQRLGCISYLITEPDEIIVEGATYISGNHPDYDTELMIEKESGKHYCLDHLLEASLNNSIRTEMIKMILFDFLIGNSDRHQNNWGFIDDKSDSALPNTYLKFCPLYDNGSSICSYISYEQAKDLLSNDKTRFNALVDTKSRSMIRINGFDKKYPTHKEMALYLLNTFPEAVNIGESFIQRLSPEIIDELVKSYSDLLEYYKMELIKKFLISKTEILNKLLEEVR